MTVRAVPVPGGTDPRSQRGATRTALAVWPTPQPSTATTMATLLDDIVYPGLVFAVVCATMTKLACQIPVFKAMEFQAQLYSASCITSLFNALFVSWPALYSLYTMYQTGFNIECGGASPYLLSLPAPSGAVFACALTCGYFVQDSLLLAVFPKETMKGVRAAEPLPRPNPSPPHTSPRACARSSAARPLTASCGCITSSHSLCGRTRC